MPVTATLRAMSPISTIVSRFEPSEIHGPWSMGEVARRSGEELALLAGVATSGPLDWSAALFLDLETGTHPRGGKCVWLAGTARFIDGTFVVTQRLAATWEAERELLVAVAEELRGARELVSFSGKSFDVPVLRARTKSEQVELKLPARHFDLYRIAGKLFPRGHFGDQKLQTFERELLRFVRDDDLPGSAMPLAWQSLEESGGEALRGAVLRHNLLDVLALPALAAELAFRFECPQELGERESVAAVRGKAGRDRASLESALAIDPDAFRVRLELSKVVERQEGDLDAALDHAERALAVAPEHLADLARRRLAQLRKRMRVTGAEEVV